MNNFAQSAMHTLGEMDSGGKFLNARYGPLGPNNKQSPFPLYKQPAYYFTDWTPSGEAESVLKQQYNLPTNTNFFRTALINDGVNVINDDLNAWTYRTQTLGNNGNTLACANDTDCSAWPGTTCNANHESWPSAHGNQAGSYCSTTVYPEMTQNGFHRVNAMQGGIGKACTTDNDCAGGYSCNNQVDFNGKNIQQTGFCAQKFSCPDGSAHYLGYPWNSGIPKPPPEEQNNGGQGYSSKEECDNSAMSQQDCVRGKSGKWFATYPGYCPIPASRRVGGPSGAVQTSSPQDVRAGFEIPAYMSNGQSNMNAGPAAFEPWNMQTPLGVPSGMEEAEAYSMSINPNPPNI